MNKVLISRRDWLRSASAFGLASTGSAFLPASPSTVERSGVIDIGARRQLLLIGSCFAGLAIQVATVQIRARPSRSSTRRPAASGRCSLAILGVVPPAPYLGWNLGKKRDSNSTMLARICPLDVFS